MSSTERNRGGGALERRSDRASGRTSVAHAGSAPAEVPQGPVERRRASQSLWSAVEALLSAGDRRALQRSLEGLQNALGCEGVALHALGASGDLEPWCARGAWRVTAGDLRDCMSVPLFRGSERVGTLDLLARAGRCWQPTQLSLIRTAAGALGAALGARIELERLRRQPGRDSVTGLPDARAFHARLAEELARARRHGLPLAVVAVDVDHFGALNARCGREIGDVVLSELALLLKLTLRESDLVARLGGDGFAVVLPETDALPALRCADRIRRAVEDHRFARAGRVSVSAGIASSPRDGLEAVELLSHAERALSLAKKAGRRRIVSTPQTHLH